MFSELRDRLKQGDRRIVGAAGSVADQVLRDDAPLCGVISLLEDDDTAVVAHAAHALMQIAMAEPVRFDVHIDALLDLLENPRQWEIGEQLPKILVRAALTNFQTERLAGILEANSGNKSNIVAACSLQGIVDLACDGRIKASVAHRLIDTALASDRKALAARARKLQKVASKL